MTLDKTLPLLISLVLTACGDQQTATHAEAPATATPPVAPVAPTPLVAPTPTAAPNVAPVDNDTRTLLTRVFRATQTRKVRLRATITMQGGRHAGTTQLVAETVPPDTRHVTMTGGPFGMDMLMSGNRTWIRPTVDAPWRMIPAGPQAGIAAAMPRIEDKILASLESGSGTLERVGEETVNGHACTIYHATWTDTVAGQTTPRQVDGRIWVGSDGLAYKVVSSTAGTESMQFDGTYEYDDALTIPLPQ